jgi:hypothetical protein
MHKIAVVVISAILAGAATGRPQAAASNSASPLDGGNGPEKVLGPQPNEALIYFMQDKRTPYDGASFQIGGDFSASLSPGTYVAYRIAAPVPAVVTVVSHYPVPNVLWNQCAVIGPYERCPEGPPVTQTKIIKQLRMEAGKTYYLLYRTPGYLWGRVADMEVMKPKKGAEELSKLLSASSPPSR